MASSTPKLAKDKGKIDRRRRRHPRYRGDFRVTVSYFLENAYQKLEGHCRDISQAGIGILLPAELTSGEVVGLNFTLPSSGALWEVRAVVRYRHGYHYGFEFLALPGEHQVSLKKYLAALEAVD
jgi:c-di-GMP-binding flagellar brake protein YcgR